MIAVLCQYVRNDFVKILRVMLDDRLNLEKHINGVVSTCYANLRNLDRIASKLTKPPKVQLPVFHFLTCPIFIFLFLCVRLNKGP